MKLGKLLFSLFAVIGIGLVVGAWLMFESRQTFLAAAVPAEGTVVGLDMVRSSSGSRSGSSYSYYPIVRFRTVDGEDVEFRSSSGSNPPSYRRGERVVVLYDPQTPEIAEIDSFFSLWGGILILAFVGVVFGTVGIGHWVWHVARLRLEAWLARHGQRVNAEVVDVAPVRWKRGRGSATWRIVAQWMDPLTRKVHVFKSRSLGFDPVPYMKGETVPVLIDPKHPKRYALDLTFLPELAG
jgi:hypothetical protein